MRRIVILGLGLLVAAGFYMLLIDTVDPPELYLMVAVALAGTAAFEASRRERVTSAEIAPRWFLRGWRAAARVPPAIAGVGVQAVAQLVSRSPARGELVAIPFRGGQDPSDMGRYAATELLGSLAPNTIVVGVDPDRGLLLVHRLGGRGRDGPGRGAGGYGAGGGDAGAGGREALDVLRLG